MSKPALAVMEAFLDAAASALIRHRKAQLFRKYASARTLLEASYSAMDPSDHPCDLGRVERDVRIEIDHQVGEYVFSVEQSVKDLKGLLADACDRDPKAATQAAGRMPVAKVPRPNTAPCEGLPADVTASLTPADMKKIISLLKTDKGLPLFEVCKRMDCPSSDIDCSAKRNAIRKYLSYLRDRGFLIVTGKGKGLSYSHSRTP